MADDPWRWLQCCEPKQTIPRKSMPCEGGILLGNTAAAGLLGCLATLGRTHISLVSGRLDDVCHILRNAIFPTKRVSSRFCATPPPTVPLKISDVVVWGLAARGNEKEKRMKRSRSRSLSAVQRPVSSVFTNTVAIVTTPFLHPARYAPLAFSMRSPWPAPSPPQPWRAWPDRQVGTAAWQPASPYKKKWCSL